MYSKDEALLNQFYSACSPLRFFSLWNVT